MKQVISLLLIFVSLFHYSTALNCYACSIGEEDADRTCIDHPENVTVTDCNKEYCTIIRQEYLDHPGIAATMFRGCENNPLRTNATIQDDTYIIYFTACTESLCNGGSGRW